DPHTAHTFSLSLHDALPILGGYTFQRTKTNFITTLSSHFTNEDLGVYNLQDGKPYGSRPIFSGLTESRLHSLLGRVNYSLFDRRSEEHTSELQSRENLVCRP